MRIPFKGVFSGFTPPHLSKKEIRRRKADKALRQAIVETLEQRWLLSVTSASVTPPMGSIVAGAPLTFALSAFSDDNSLALWDCGWGDGTADDMPGGSASTMSHTFANPGVYTISATAFDDAGPGYPVTQTLTVNPPMFNINPATVTMQAGQTFAADVGVVDGFHGNPGDYSGTVSLNGVSYPITGAADGSGNLILQANLTAPYFTGTFSPSISVDDTVVGLYDRRENSQERGLARPIGAEDRHHFAGVDGELDRVERRRRLTRPLFRNPVGEQDGFAAF